MAHGDFNPQVSRPDWATGDVDLERPSAARIYDYLLGGFHNFEIDRIFAKRAVEAYPDSADTAKVNRGFLRRAVQFLTSQGIDQFIDIGSGIPTVGHVHEVAQRTIPAARVMYVDIDPIAVAHSKALLANNPTADIIQVDARRVEDVLSHERTTSLLDFSRPVGILFVAILHLIVDNTEAYETVARYRRSLVPNSYIAIAHPSFDGAPEEIKERYLALGKDAGIPTRHRTRSEIEPFFRELDLVEPGLVHAPLWRPETDSDLMLDRPGRSLGIVGVGKVR